MHSQPPWINSLQDLRGTRKPTSKFSPPTARRSWLKRSLGCPQWRPLLHAVAQGCGPRHPAASGGPSRRRGSRELAPRSWQPRPGRDTRHLHMCIVGHKGSGHTCPPQGPTGGPGIRTPAAPRPWGVRCWRERQDPGAPAASAASAPRTSCWAGSALGPAFETPSTLRQSLCSA